MQLIDVVVYLILSFKIYLKLILIVFCWYIVVFFINVIRWENMIYCILYQDYLYIYKMVYGFDFIRLIM